MTVLTAVVRSLSQRRYDSEVAMVFISSVRRVSLAILLCGTSFCFPHATATSCHADDWPQWRGVERDGVWREEGIVNELPDGQLPLEWSVPIGAGYSGPTVADGLVFITDRQTEGSKQSERILCFDSKTGDAVWKQEYDAPYSISYTAGPRASITIDEGHAYSVGAMGHFYCLNAKTGAVIWKRDLNEDYEIDMPIWGIAASPLIYGDLVIQQVVGKDATYVAFNKNSGQEVWRALRERGGYSSPIIIQQAGKDVLIGWTGESVTALDPSDGKVIWSQPMPSSRMPIGIATPSVDQDLVLVSSFYDGSMMIRAPKDALTSELLWRAVGRDEQNTESLHAMIGTPIVQDGYVYGFDSYGELRCLEATTGKRIWEDLTAVPKARWSTVHMVRHADRVWMFNERGELLITTLSPQGLTIHDRAQLIEPTTTQLRQRGGVCWSHPAFAEKSVFARNDEKLVKASLQQ
jgi:outer membrane protein assembly factor BamB